MLKKIGRLILGGILFILLISINCFASGESVTQFEPYSEWAKDVGYKYELICLESPQRNSLRWEIANLIAELNLDQVSYSGVEINFSDINEISPAVKQNIFKIVNAGIIKGCENNTFKPFNAITRAEFVVMLDRSGLLSSNSSKKHTVYFKDTENHWAEAEIYNAVNAGIVNGKAEEYFCPEDNITIEEILIILDRLVNYNKISEEQLIDSLTKTFNTRRYSEEEKYVVEEIYKDIYWVQEEMEIYQYTLVEYDYQDINELVTLEDVLTWRYYYDSGSSSLKPFDVAKRLNENTKELYFKTTNQYDRAVDGGREIGYYFGLGQDNIDYARPVTLNEFLVPLYNYIKVQDTDIKFSNINTFTDEEQAAIKRMVYHGILPNSESEFPGNKYMTKALLNYITVKINSKEDIYLYSHFFLDRKEHSIEKDKTKMPYNYDDYPFIIRPMENEAYEIPFFVAKDKAPYEKTLNPKETYYKARPYYHQIETKVSKYFNTILNVDYNTISEEIFNSLEEEKLFYWSKINQQELYKEYVQYVKDNEIILSGNVEPIIPIFYYSGEGGYRFRVKLQLEVKNSKTNLNLLLGDTVYGRQSIFEHIKPADIVYEGNKFELYVDIPIGIYEDNSFNQHSAGILGIVKVFSTISLQKNGNIYLQDK